MQTGMTGGKTTSSLWDDCAQISTPEAPLSLGRRGFLSGLDALIALLCLPSRFFPLGKIYSVALLLVGLPAQSAATLLCKLKLQPSFVVPHFSGFYPSPERLT